MNPALLSRTKDLLIKHEGYKTFPYLDTANKITIGVGFNLSDRGIDKDWIDSNLEKDIQYHYDHIKTNYIYFHYLSDDRKMALINMSYNLGFKNFQKFTKMHEALAENDYVTAAKEILESKWALQVGSRASEIAEIIKLGVMGYGSTG